MPKGEAAGRDAGGVQWQGVPHELKKEVRARAANSDIQAQDTLRQLQGRLSALEGTIESEHKAINERLLGMEAHLSTIAASMRAPRADGGYSSGSDNSDAASIKVA